MDTLKITPNQNEEAIFASRIDTLDDLGHYKNFLEQLYTKQGITKILLNLSYLG